MKASVDRLRWGLAAAAVVLLIVLAGSIGYGRYRAGKLWQGIVRRSGAHITHETDGFTYSQTVKGRTIFTLHAAKAIQHGDGKWTLHDVVVTLYGKTPADVDHLYCNDVEYDETTGVATAIGEVNMDLEVPSAVGHGAVVGTEPNAARGVSADDRMIHVKTSGLVYVKQLGVAATPQLVEFHYADIQGTSRGAEFDSGDSVLHLLADVVVMGEVRQQAMTVHAAKADLDRAADTIALSHPVGESAGRRAAAELAVLHLRTDGSLESATASGGVMLDAGSRHVAATAFDGTFGATSLPIATRLTGGVVMTDSDPARPMQGHAAQVETSFTPQGEMSSLIAKGAADVTFREHRAGTADLARAMHGDVIHATFVPVAVESKAVRGGHRSQSRLSELVATGAASAMGDSVVAATKEHAAEMRSNAVSANELRATFDTDGAKAQIRQLVGHGSTRLTQNSAGGGLESSSGDALELNFARGASASGLQVASSTQTGHVVIHSLAEAKSGAKTAPVPADASAESAAFDGATERLVLTGSAQFAQGGTALSAASIAVEQKSGNAVADGDVLATMLPSKSDAKAEATHVSSARARLDKAAGTADFTGSAAMPARLWQGASQVQAADLFFDNARKTLTAKPAAGGLVHAVLVSAPAAGKAGAAQVVRVESESMVYDDANREATFSGRVTMDGETGKVHALRGVVLLTAAETKAVAGAATPLGGSVRRIVLTGDVTVDQPGRTATGEELVYTAADQSFVLTGTAAKPPKVVDAQQGSVTGAVLVFHKGDRSVVASGADASAAKTGRVRTEMPVKASSH